MYFVANYVNSGDVAAELSGGADGTYIFAFAASYAELCVDGRTLVAAFAVDHCYGAGGAVAGAVAAVLTVGGGNAQVGIDGRGSYLRDALCRGVDRADGSGRTDIGAARAFGQTIALGEYHPRLHETAWLKRRAQDAGRTFAHAQLARCAA